MEVEPDYRVRCGYRLPTELEWEFACRAGAETRWSFGAASDELASQYAWWFGNGHDGGNRRAFPVASLKPNDLGLFDMHGNLNEWCLDSTRPQGALYQDDVECGTRGGSYLSLLPAVACDNRLVLGRKIRGPNVSFRVCQSLPSPAR